MGRHAAADGAGTDPIVAAALARQDVVSAGTRHATADGSADGSDDGGGALGWPGDTTTGGGLGWPGSLDTAGDTAGHDADHDAEQDAGDRTARIDAVPAVPGAAGVHLSDDAGPPAPRGWRRLFGGTAA